MFNSLLERFLRYVQIYSESSSENAENGVMPSTPQQMDFAKSIVSELETMGLCDLQISKNCYVYGFLPATKGMENVPSVCFLAHLDTVEEVSGLNVKPQVHKNYDGSPIQLADGRVLEPKTDEALAASGALGNDTIITTDGTTLLGADDKAGIAEIITAIEYFISHPEIAHGKIEVMFSPDEETGHGMDKVPLELIKSKRAYTIDGGHIGELETECFNAVGSKVVFTGKSVHTGTARSGGLINAVSMAAQFVQSLPYRERPETTDGYEGFFSPMQISGTIECAEVSLLLRDFTEEGIERRKILVEQLAQSVAASFGGSVKVEHKTQYKNMSARLAENPEVVQDLVSAYKASGVEPLFVPIRGGTDGSRLTEMGLPTPNIFTGGHNMHSRYEWASLHQMQKACEVIVNLVKVIAS